MGRLSETPNSQIAEGFFLLPRPFYDLLEHPDKLPLVIDQSLKGRHFPSSQQFSHVPEVLSEDVIVALFGKPSVTVLVFSSRALETRLGDPSATQLDLAAIDLLVAIGTY